MSSGQPPTIAPIPTWSNGEEPVLSIPQQFLTSENSGNLTGLTASARTSRTRVDLLPSPPREITTAAPSIQDEDGNATPAQEPPREDARAEPMVSLTILVLSGDRKKFTFHPDTTAGRVKEMIWSTWDANWTKATIPPNPSYLRLLYLGRILQDDDTLEKLKLPTHIPKPDYEEGQDSPYATTIMHLSIRPIAPPTDDGFSKKGRRRLRSEGGDETEVQGGCCSGCVIC